MTLLPSLAYPFDMDNNVQDLSQKKDALYIELTDLTLQSLESGALSLEDSQDASRFILERLDALETETLLEAFVETLADRWPCFKPAAVSRANQTVINNDQQQLSTIEHEIESMQNQTT